MFDFAWSEIALIGIVALVAIGPKDLPVAIKAVAQAIKKARRMAGEFQTHVDEMVREANLHEVREQFNEIRRMDIKGKILSAVDDDGSIRKGLSEPIMDFSPPPPAVPVHDTVHDTGPAPDALSGCRRWKCPHTGARDSPGARVRAAELCRARLDRPVDAAMPRPPPLRPRSSRLLRRQRRPNTPDPR